MTTKAQEFNIEVTSVPREHVKNVLRALLHSIFFHRLLVNVTPREQRFLDTTVSTTDNREVENLIEERASELFQNISSSTTKQGKMAVLFYEQRDKKVWLLSKAKELVCWERWGITITLAQPQSDQERQKAVRSVERQLSQCLLDILRCANDNKEHIPSIKTIEGNPFPYHIAILTQSESWASMIKRLLVTDAPTFTNTEDENVASPLPSPRPSSQRQGSSGQVGTSESGNGGMARPVPVSSRSSSSSIGAPPRSPSRANK